MAELLGKGVGSWTSREDADFSNFIFGGDMADEIRERAIEIAKQQMLADKKAKKEAEAEANINRDGVDNLIVLEKQRKRLQELELRLQNQTQNEQPIKIKKPPYLLYGGVGLVIIIGAMYIFTRR